MRSHSNSRRTQFRSVVELAQVSIGDPLIETRAIMSDLQNDLSTAGYFRCVVYRPSLNSGRVNYRSFNYWDANYDQSGLGSLHAVDLWGIGISSREYHPRIISPCITLTSGFLVSEFPSLVDSLPSRYEALRRIASHKTVLACSAISMCDWSLRFQ